MDNSLFDAEEDDKENVNSASKLITENDERTREALRTKTQGEEVWHCEGFRISVAMKNVELLMALWACIILFRATVAF